MTITITRKTTRKQLEKLFKKLRQKKLFDARKYFGAIHYKEDPVVIQKRLRSEWN